MFNKKRGETIIEVMVAMTILAIVLAGLYSVIVSISSLTVASRDRTRAVALAQRGLAEFERNIKDSCVNISAGNALNLVTTEDGLKNYIKATDGTNPALETDNPYPVGYAAYKGKFIKVVSIVEWTNKQLGNQKIELIEMVRKSE